MKINVLLLTCAEDKEASKITNSLLEKRLISCAKKLPISSTFLWKGKIEKSKEVLLIMDSIEENFAKIQAEVKKLHSYETFVLTSIPINQTTQSVKDWMKSELK